MKNRLEGEIHIYRLNLSETSDEQYAQALRLLDSDERVRADRYRHEPSKRSFVQVRSALRRLLSHYLGQPAESICFELGEKGKPSLAGAESNQGLVFNVSHSGDFGLIALAMDTELGIDVERIRAMTYMDGMAERCFANCELAWWKALPEDRRQAAFYDFWSCKEAFVKATGEGIALGLDACVVDLSGPPRLVSVPASCGKAHDWRLAEIEVGAGHSAAVCYRGGPRLVRFGNGIALCENYELSLNWL